MPMRILQQHTLLTHDPVTQAALVEALADRESPRELARMYRARAEYAVRALSEGSCRPIPADAGFYVMLDCRPWLRAGRARDTVMLARDILRAVHVATVPGTDFGAPETLRLSLCCDRFEEACDRLGAYFEALPAQAEREAATERSLA